MKHLNLFENFLNEENKNNVFDRLYDKINNWEDDITGTNSEFIIYMTVLVYELDKLTSDKQEVIKTMINQMDESKETKIWNRIIKTIQNFV